MSVTLHTGLGDIKLELYCEQAPKSCENFLALCASNYYDNCLFHRNIKGFMVQTGDPSGTGKGGKSIWNRKYEDEISETLKHNSRGVVSMANSGPNTNGSQFFITYGKQPHLDMKYTIIGRVIDGVDVLDDLEKLPVEERTYRPLTDHPDEQDRPMRTVAILESCLAKESCIIYRGRRFTTGKFQKLHEIMANEKAVVLYPAKDAVCLDNADCFVESDDFYNCILIDGTWKQAKEIYQQNEFLHNLTKVSIENISSSYLIRKQPSANYISTLEAAAKVIEIWERKPEFSKEMLVALEEMCNIQLSHGDQIHK